MRRREFITLLSGAAGLWPLAARAKKMSKLPTIGLLGAQAPSDWNEWISAFVRRLHDLGWNEDRNIVIEYRWAGGSGDRAADLAAEFIRLKVDVILTSGSML